MIRAYAKRITLIMRSIRKGNDNENTYNTVDNVDLNNTNDKNDYNGGSCGGGGLLNSVAVLL